jgi:hypothetical protein
MLTAYYEACGGVFLGASEVITVVLNKPKVRYLPWNVCCPYAAKLLSQVTPTRATSIGSERIVNHLRSRVTNVSSFNNKVTRYRVVLSIQG